MITPAAYQARTVGVFGLGRTGLASVRALLAAGATVYVGDDAVMLPESVRGLPRLSIDMIDQLDHLLLSPGVPLTGDRTHPIVIAAQARNVELIGDFDLFEAARAGLPAHKLVVITGTNGKSTTTALIGHLLSSAGMPVAVGGNIGTAIMGLDPLEDGGAYVIEASSFQLDLTRHFNADIAIVLNLAPDHLDRHGSFEAYAAAKGRLFAMQRGGYALVKADPALLPFAEKGAGIPVPMGCRDTVYVEEGWLIDAMSGDGVERVIHLEGLPAYRGAHQQENAVAAYMTARLLGLSAQVIAEGLRSFRGLRHRQQWVAEVEGVTYINDSKGTNVDAASRALASFDRVHWIAGGRTKGEDLTALRAAMTPVAGAYLIGESSDEFAVALADKVTCRKMERLDRAFSAAADAAVPGDVVLLSPAAMALDQYTSFEERGDAFVALVQARADGAT